MTTFQTEAIVAIKYLSCICHSFPLVELKDIRRECISLSLLYYLRLTVAVVVEFLMTNLKFVYNSNSIAALLAVAAMIVTSNKKNCLSLIEYLIKATHLNGDLSVLWLGNIAEKLFHFKKEVPLLLCHVG